MDRKEAIDKLWRMGNLEWKLKGVQKEMRRAVLNSKGKKTVFLCSRRLGKCLEEGTEIITTKGIKKIEEIKPGDMVYGYNYDGTVEPTKVLEVVYQGEKEVIDLTHGGKKIVTATKEHPWMTYNTGTGKLEEKTTEEVLKNPRLKIKREFVQSPCGDIHEPHAYSIGALLGDGCSREGKFAIHISSEDHIIPEAVAGELGCEFYKQSANNYTWVISHNPKQDFRGQSRKGRIDKKPECSYYMDWCDGRKAHEKIVDLDIVKTWSRKSCLNFLAGLLDTDGSVSFTQNRLNIMYTSQSKSILEAVQFLIYQLFQYKAEIREDTRDKYVNGNAYYCHLSNNLFSKKMLKELSPYLKVDRKKWKDKYEDALENNSNPEFMGVKDGGRRKARCWDLSINNESHLYLTADGLVTHNTFVMMAIAVEYALTKPNSIIKVLFPKKKDAKAVARDQMKVILDDCPLDLKPEWKEQDKIFVFPNGSEIQMAGTDGGSAESVRGSRCHLALLDEAGFHDYHEFSYILQSIIMPTLLTTNGKMILASTPSKEPDHPFMVDYVVPFRRDGKLIEYDIHSNPLITEDMIDDIADEFPGGKQDPNFLREFMLKSDVKTSDFVIPEFTRDLQDDIVREVKTLPPKYDIYTSCDPALGDLTVVLFSYYDFINRKIVVLDEFILGGDDSVSATTQDIADAVKRKEKMLFTDPMTGIPRDVHLRVIDNNNKFLVQDLNIEHNLNFVATAKDNKEAQVNKVRMLLKQGDVVIHPRCKNLIYHIQTARWQKTQDGRILNKFQKVRANREKGLKAHHCDGLDALIYLVRNVDFNRNPYPSGYFDPRGENIFYPDGSQNSRDKEIQDLMSTIMNSNKKNNN